MRTICSKARRGSDPFTGLLFIFESVMICLFFLLTWVALLAVALFGMAFLHWAESASSRVPGYASRLGGVISVKPCLKGHDY